MSYGFLLGLRNTRNGWLEVQNGLNQARLLILLIPGMFFFCYFFSSSSSFLLFLFFSSSSFVGDLGLYRKP